MSKPRYSVIKDHILRQIDSRQLTAGDRVPSENELASQFAVSRMTARRALNDLGDRGILVRAQGLGSFVADGRPMSSMVEIRSIDEEIRSRGNTHQTRVVTLEAISADLQTCTGLGIDLGTEVFHSVLVHSENERPLQYEERFVNPRFGPDYLHQDFSTCTPSSYLSSISPLTEADQIIEAVCLEADIARLLQTDSSEPCLKLTRRTWGHRGIVSLATLMYPGSRYRLGGHLNF